jgi:hypothetical protein
MQSESQDVMQHTVEGPEHCRHDLIGVPLGWLDWLQGRCWQSPAGELLLYQTYATVMVPSQAQPLASYCKNSRLKLPKHTACCFLSRHRCPLFVTWCYSVVRRATNNSYWINNEQSWVHGLAFHCVWFCEMNSRGSFSERGQHRHL